MQNLQINTIDADKTILDESAIQTFRADLRGDLLLPGSDAYEEARLVWNGMIDRHPALVARCAGPADVISSVNLARTRHLLVSVRGGGHNVSGSAIAEGGLVIDLSQMRSVRVDPVRRTARVEGGATWADVDHETQAFGLATPGGVVSETGVAGLTLGGGFGWLTRRLGLSCDNLLSADIVTADGQLRIASPTENPDLFWAIRGGGGNFGVVTSFEFRLYPVGPMVVLAAPFYPATRAGEALRFFRDYMARAPEELGAIATLWSLPGTDEFPIEWHGEPVVAFIAVYSGPVEEGERLVKPLREFDKPIADLSTPMRYVDAQTFYDGDYPNGMLYYWKSIILDELSDEVIETLATHGIARPSRLSNVDIWYLGGAMRRVRPDATAFWRRDAPVLVGAEANWTDPSKAEENIQWARELIARLRPFSSGGSYVNFAGFGEEKDRLVREVYGGNYARLVEVKKRYDPGNLFRVNLNIDPGA